MMGKRGQLMVGVGVLALAVGVLAGRLLGSKDEVMPTVDTGNTLAWTAAQAWREPQAPMDAQLPLDPPVSMGMPAVTDTQTPADAQVPMDAPAPREEPPTSLVHPGGNASPVTNAADAPSKPSLPPPNWRGNEPYAVLDELLRAAHTALSDYRLTTPDTDSAYYYYQQVLALDPDNSQATAGFSLIAERYLELATKAFEKGQEKKAQQYVSLGLRIKNDHPELLAFHHRLASQEAQRWSRRAPRHCQEQSQERPV